MWYIDFFGRILTNVKEFIFGMNTGEVVSLMGTTIAGIGVVATLITIVVGGYAIYLQRALSKQSKLEFKEQVDKMLSTASKDPMILENFIKCIVEKDEFKERFLDLIRTETENILDSRQTIELEEQEKQGYEPSREELKIQKVQNQFQEKE